MDSTKIGKVRAQIEAAFNRLPLPDFNLLLENLDPADDDKALFFESLSGKPWPDLEPAFLQERWSYFSYLDPEGYRYCLPALLTACLDDFTPDNSLLHPTLFSLRPRFWRLYRYGQDKPYAHQISLFDKNQYRAVCSFLGLALETGRYWHLGASALRWFWNKYEHPALTQAVDRYRELTNFSYPPFQTPAIATLAEQIESAFAATSYPGDEHICDPRPGDDEVSEYAMEFRGIMWQKLHPTFLLLHYAALSFFTHEAFRYYLPAYLLADLYGFERGEAGAADPVYHLTHGLAERPGLTDAMIAQMIEQAQAENPDLQLTPEMYKVGDSYDWHAYALERFAGFNRDERAAIAAYLEHAAAADPYERPVIETALDQYWRKI